MSARQSSALDPDFTVHFEPPAIPTLDADDASGGVAQTVMPLVGVAGFSFVYLVHPTPSSLLIGGAVILSTIVSSVGMGLGNRLRTERRARRKQLVFLSDLDTGVERVVSELRAASVPVLAENPSATERVWQLCSGTAPVPRGRDRADHLHVRVGTGRAPVTGATESAPATASAAELDLPCAQAHVAALDLLRGIDGWPFLLPIASGTVQVVGAPGDAQRMVRALVLAACSTHRPEDLAVLVVARPDRRRDWRWTRWLPHRLHEQAVPDQAAAIDALGARLGSADAPQHLLVVADGIEVGSAVDLALASAIAADPSLCLVRLAREEDTGRRFPALVDCATDGSARVRLQERGTDVVIVADGVSVAEAEAAARALSGLLPALRKTEATAATSLSESTRSAVHRLVAGTPRWSTEEDADFLSVVLGSDASGQPVELDLKEPAAGGVGPHGVAVGATGSGKSELLRALILGLAARHHSDDLSLLLADFKGGATYIGLSDLPHVGGVITNLEADVHLIVRAQVSIEGELRRRQEQLHAFDVANITEYRSERRRHPDRPPMPHLVIIVDEFSELLEQEPEFISTFASIGRLGRSLGLHLLLASQRLDEGRLRGLESHLSYRIALRTFNVADSIAAIGTRDAYTLPSVPGSALIRTDDGTPRFFRSDYAASPLDPPEREERARVRVFTADGFTLEPPTRDEDAIGEAEPTRTAVEVAAEHLPAMMAPAHRIWLDPLVRKVRLARLPRPEPADVSIALAELDEPHRQRKSVVHLDLTSSAASIAVAGAAQTGKTTFVRTVVVAAADAFSPEQVGFLILDATGGCFALRTVPHVLDYATLDDETGYRRIVGFARSSLQHRAEAVRARGLAGFAELRSQWSDDDVRSAGAADLFLVVDDLADHARDNDDLDADLRDLLARGPGLGVHVLLTVRRWGDLRIVLHDLIPTKIELALNDVSDSVYQRRGGDRIPLDQRGRAMGSQGLMQIALPVVAGAENDDDEAAEYARTIELLVERWQGRAVVRPVPSAPTVLTLAEVSARARPGRPVLGVDASDASSLATWDCFGTEPNLLITGPPGSGKTNAISVVIAQLTSSLTPDQVRFTVLDPRMRLSGVVPDSHRLAMAASATRAAEVIAQLQSDLMERMPRSDGLDAFFADPRWSRRWEVLVVDDAHLFARNPLDALEEVLPFAHVLGLSVIAATRDGEFAAGPVTRMLSGIGSTSLQLAGASVDDPIAARGRAVLSRPGSPSRPVVTPLAGDGVIREHLVPAPQQEEE